MKPVYDAVITGGGVIGASIAYHLALDGLKKILVIDKNPAPGLGSTGKATGGFRAQFGSGINIKLSLLSRKKLLSFKNETGVDSCFQQRGYLFIAQNEHELNTLKQANLLQKSCGLDEAEIIGAEEIKKLNPHIKYNGIIGGAFCNSDGFISPIQILKGYTEAAERLGVKFQYGTEVTGFFSEEGNIKSVTTAGDSISAGIFINAAGAWAGEIAKLAGADIPLKPLKRQVAVINKKNLLPESLPMTIWTGSSFHFRMRDGNLILLLPDEPVSKEPFSTEVEDKWLDKVFAIAKDKIPCLQNCRVDKAASWAGLYEMSPDEHVMLGLAVGKNNFYLANGSSGHGVMHSPAIGQLLAEIILDGKSKSIDTHELSPARFKQNKPIQSINFF